MKKCFAIILAAVLALSLIGCDDDDSAKASDPSESMVESYRNSAQRLIVTGNYEGAADVLREGIDKTDSQELLFMLVEVEQLIQNSQTDATQTTTGPNLEPSAESTVEPTTGPTTESTNRPTIQPTVGSTIVDLEEVQRRINVFLSNFAEASFQSYPCSKYEMLSFAYTHARINEDGEVRFGNSEYYISDTDTNNILNKYFGVSYEENGAPDTVEYTDQYGTQHIRYDGSYYYFPAADGGFYGYVAIAKEMRKNSDGSYTVKFDVYSLAALWEDEASNYYDYTATQASTSDALEFCYSGTAKVKDHTRSDGTQSYLLTAFSRD